MARTDRLAGRIGSLRFLCFGAILFFGVAAAESWPKGVPPSALALLAGLSLFAFVALIIRHGLVLNQSERARHLVEINRKGLRRFGGEWRSEPIPEAAGIYAKSHDGTEDWPAYAVDLDLFGPSSLMQLCDATHTSLGEQALRRALSRAAEPGENTGASGPASIAEWQQRQDAVRELAPLLDLRQALEVEGRVLSDVLKGAGAMKITTGGRPRAPNKPDPTPLLRWAEGTPLLTGPQPYLVWLSYLPLLTVPIFLLAVSLPGAGRIPGLNAVLFGLVMGQVLLLLHTAPRIKQIIEAVGARETSFSAYAQMLTLLSQAPLHTPGNQALKAALHSGPAPGGDPQAHGAQKGPAQHMRRLQGYYASLNLRQNPIMWLPLNGLLLWDLYFALRIERWQVEVGARLRDWLTALGELEARASLAGLAHDNPAWTWPRLVSSPAQFAADDLGHPLIAADKRVGNDVALPGPGGAWLLTGSNMSGKSTLLRSIGLCQVMAQAGAPVCARRAALSPLRLRTVMRVDDSLAQGVSHFYAELRRLKDTVDAARGPASSSSASSSGSTLCYLLDEILHGTNTRERELGARAIIRMLCKSGAVGAVSTHDLSLASLEQETSGAVVNVHFTEIIQGDQMTFDYRLRPGPVQTTNALRLMRLCGIDLDFAEPPDHPPVASAPKGG